MPGALVALLAMLSVGPNPSQSFHVPTLYTAPGSSYGSIPKGVHTQRCRLHQGRAVRAGTAFCPAPENAGSEEDSQRAGLPSPFGQQFNEALTLRGSTNVPEDNDPEATYLWSKMPEESKRTYCYRKVLGRGAFGLVVLAQKVGRADLQHAGLYGDADLVAVKFIRTVYGAEPLAMREGLVQSTIESPFVPKCFDYGITNGVVYLVQEFIPGVPLDKVLDENGPLSSLEVADVGKQVASALQSIHEAGFCYRDVKPQNIMRCGEGRDAKYRLIDFGSTAGIGGCLLGGVQHPDFSSCYLDPHPEHTQNRLRGLFRDMCTCDEGMLSTDQLVEVLEASGLRSKVAQRTTKDLMEEYRLSSPSCTCTSSPSAETWVTEQVFLDMFARIVHEQDKGVPAGTLPFMAPEQFATEESGSAPYSPRSDIYSLGVTLYRLLSAKFPQNVPGKVRGRTMSFKQSLEVWTQLHGSAHGPLPLASSVAPEVGADLDTIIATALSRSSTERQSSAHELSQQLEALLYAVDLPTGEKEKRQAMEEEEEELPKSLLPCGVLVECNQWTAGQVGVLLPQHGDDISVFDPAAEAFGVFDPSQDPVETERKFRAFSSYIDVNVHAFSSSEEEKP